MSRLLDTDILSEVLKQKNPIVVQKAAAYLQVHQRFTFSAVTRYEVIRGLKAKGAAQQLQRFITFCQHSLILPITADILDRAADHWVTANQTGQHKGRRPHSRRDGSGTCANPGYREHQGFLVDNRASAGGLASAVGQATESRRVCGLGDGGVSVVTCRGRTK